MRHSLYATAALAALFLSSCSDDPVGTSSPTSTEYSKATLEYYGSEVDAIWGRAADDVYMAGNIFGHYDGERWEAFEFPSRPQGIYTIFSGSDGVVNWLSYNALYKQNGVAWERIPFEFYFEEYWVADSGNLYLMSWQGHFWRVENTSVTELDSLPDVDNTHFTTLAGDDDDNIFATRSDGAILQYNGSTWAAVHPGIGWNFDSAWKVPDGPLYVTSWYDTLYSYDGSQLVPVDLGPSFSARRVHGNSPAEVYVEGRDYGSNCESLRKRRAGGWTTLNCDPNTNEFSVWGAQTGETFIGSRNKLVRIKGGSRDVLLGADFDDWSYDGRINDMWGSETDGIVAIGATARRYFEGQWTDLHKEELTLIPAEAVWGTSVRDLWAVGESMILHFDGNDWTWVHGANQQRMQDVWSDSDEVIAVGTFGTILRRRGGEWTTMPTPTTYHMFAVWGWGDGAFAAGEAGVILRFDGDDWKIEDSPINWTIHDLFGFSPNDILAVGSSALEICRFDGREWLPVEVDKPQGPMVSVWASSPRNIFIASSYGAVLRYDGNEWSTLPRYMGSPQCVWGTSQGELLVGGSAILRYQR